MDTKQIAAMLTAALLASIVAMWLASRYRRPHCPRCRSRDLARDGPAARCRTCGSVFQSPRGM